jgi:cob(I)alamin adenosyltransferase
MIVKEFNNLIDMCEYQFLDEELSNELKTIKQKLFDFQIERLSALIDDSGKVENMPKDEEDLQREMTELIIRINMFLQAD